MGFISWMCKYVGFIYGVQVVGNDFWCLQDVQGDPRDGATYSHVSHSYWRIDCILQDIPNIRHNIGMNMEHSSNTISKHNHCMLW